MSAAWLFYSPLQYFRTAGLPNWTAAMAVVAVHAGITGAAAAVTADRLLAAQGVAGLVAQVNTVLRAAGAAVDTVVVFALAAGGVAALDAVFSQSGKSQRLVEFTGIAHVTQIPWALLSLAILAGFWEPPMFRLPPDATVSEAQQAAEDYARNAQTSGLPGALNAIRIGFGLWLVALQACALRVISRFTVGGAWAAGIALALVFVVAHWTL